MKGIQDFNRKIFCIMWRLSLDKSNISSFKDEKNSKTEPISKVSILIFGNWSTDFGTRDQFKVFQSIIVFYKIISDTYGIYHMYIPRVTGKNPFSLISTLEPLCTIILSKRTTYNAGAMFISKNMRSSSRLIEIDFRTQKRDTMIHKSLQIL